MLATEHPEGVPLHAPDPHTVAVHVARVLKNTGSANRTVAVAFATRHHLFETTRSGTAERRPKK
jgi:hypothetical protein